MCTAEAVWGWQCSMPSWVSHHIISIIASYSRQQTDIWLPVKCKICHNEVFYCSSKTVRDGNFSENNVKLANSLQTGGGYNLYSVAATTITTKSMTRSAYYDIQSYVGDKYFTLENYYRDLRDSNGKRIAEAHEIPSGRVKKASAADYATGSF